jgi:hypothetical protein
MQGQAQQQLQQRQQQHVPEHVWSEQRHAASPAFHLPTAHCPLPTALHPPPRRCHSHFWANASLVQVGLAGSSSQPAASYSISSQVPGSAAGKALQGCVLLLDPQACHSSGALAHSSSTLHRCAAPLHA